MLGSSKKMADNVLRVARVLKSLPHQNAMDVIYLDSGTTAYAVPVMSHSAGYNHGVHYLPDPRPKDFNGKPTDVDLGLGEPGDRDMLAVVANLMSNPIIIGFMYPEVTHNAFEYDKFPDMRVDRHTSDFETITMADGSFCLRHPGGTSIMVGDVPDLTGEDFDKKYKKNRNRVAIKPVTIRVQNSVIKIDTNGDVTISSTNNVSISSVAKLSLSGKEIDIIAKKKLTLSGNPVVSNS